MGEEREGTSDKKDGIKPSQVTAAALAAVTAAFLGSTLGVAGTVAGAGIASVVSTVGGELYLRSMRKTKEAAQRTREAALALADPSTRQQAGPGRQPRQVSGQHTNNYHPPTQSWAGRANDMRPGVGTGYQPRQPPNNRVPGLGAGRSVGGDPTVVIPQLNLRSPGAESGEEQVRRGYRLHWPLIVGTSVVGFLIAILMITGFEGVTGKSISGDEVTTVGHLWSGGGDQPDNPSTSGDDETVQPSESRVPTTTTPQNGTEGGKQSTTNGSTPSASVPGSSTPSTSVPKSVTPSTSVPESSNRSRTPNFPSSNNAPGGRNQRPGSDGGDGAPGSTGR
ncbi:hypothetical protein NONI108955_25840 [Nocardia ninae]|uniref:Uncharacterized protein n=1 Tax=Nocardia ninae NBRC 108245 TaxID=1210091 RepID=A0A511MIF7_9NOCA|nr:hypothetical protein [Nocardia ninae]GEM40422.1 hypothetical protein NN4_49410 [Nocardia ninae NBRC 108245]